jgi:lysozyme family protein
VIDVRDKTSKYETSSNCRALSEIAKRYIAAGGLKQSAPCVADRIAEGAHAKAWSTQEQRTRMAKAIIEFEARRDSKGRLAVYELPAGDGGGRYEVARINDRYHKAEVDHVVALIKAGKHDEAEAYVVDFIAKYSDVVIGWSSDAGVEFYLRDCAFNRGPKGAARILQRAADVPDDGEVGPKTCSAIANMSPEQLLLHLRAAREQHERAVVHRDESSKFWQGLVKRWDNALSIGRKFSAEKAAPAADEPGTPTSSPRAGWIGALIAAVASWFPRPKLTGGPKTAPERPAAQQGTSAPGEAGPP